MAKHVKPIEVTPKSELMRLLDEADSSSPVLLERRGVVYRLSTVKDSDEIEREWDAEAVRKNLDKVIGSWEHLDTDQMIEDIYRWRREGSREPMDP